MHAQEENYRHSIGRKRQTILWLKKNIKITNLKWLNGRHAYLLRNCNLWRSYSCLCSSGITRVGCKVCVTHCDLSCMNALAKYIQFWCTIKCNRKYSIHLYTQFININININISKVIITSMVQISAI